MDKSQGDILLCRSIMKHQVWNRKPLSKGQAWVELIMLAEFEPIIIKTRTGNLQIQRGQYSTSTRGLALRWGWSKNKVARFLDELKTDQQIDLRTDQSKSALTSIITIINYKEGQRFGPAKGPANGRKTDQPYIIENELTNKNTPPISPSRGNGAHLFSSDPFFEFSLFRQQFPAWSEDHAREIYDSMRDWSAADGKKKIDWIATARNFHRSDLKRQAPKQQRFLGVHEHNAELLKKIQAEATSEDE